MISLHLFLPIEQQTLHVDPGCWKIRIDFNALPFYRRTHLELLDSVLVQVDPGFRNLTLLSMHLEKIIKQHNYGEQIIENTH